MATYFYRASWLLLVLCASLCGTLVRAEVPVPALTGHVIDQTGTLSAGEKAALEQTLSTFEARKGSQIAVLIVPTTKPEAVEQFSIRVAEAWKLGRKQVDDGVILLIAKSDRTLRIEVGYGLEGALSDVVSHRIINEIITPRFKQGDFAGGINAGVSQMIRVIDGEPLPASRSKLFDVEGGAQKYIIILIIFAWVIGHLMASLFGRFPGSIVTGGGHRLFGVDVSGCNVYCSACGLSRAVIHPILHQYGGRNFIG